MLSKKEKSLKKFRWILILILTAVHISAEARNADTHSDKILSIGEENRSTTQEQADSIMRLAIGKAAQYRHTISMYEAEIYIKGRTEILKQNILMRLAHHIFPVDWRNKDMLFEMVSQSRYNAPYDYIHNIQAVNGNSVPNESKRQEALAFLNLNVYSPTAYDDAIFLPIADNAFRFYSFNLDEILWLNGQRVFKIRFLPKQWSQKLVCGHLYIFDRSWGIHKIDMNGRYSFAEFNVVMEFGRDYRRFFLPEKADLFLRYKLLGNVVATSYHSSFSYKKVERMDEEEWKRKWKSLDLTSYTELPDTVPIVRDTAYWHAYRDIPLSREEELLYARRETKADTLPKDTVRNIRQYIHLTSHLTNSVNMDYKSTRIKYSGLLNPFQLGYSARNGITYKQQFRISKTFDRDKQLRLHPEIGFVFKRKQIFFKLRGDWEYLPQRRGALSIEVGNGNESYSSDITDQINEELRDSTFNFDDLNLEYFKHYYAEIRNNIELFNGFELITGLSYHRRVPSRRQTDIDPGDNVEQILNQDFNDFTPVIGIRYTPRQYYRMDGYRKEYLYSYYPTISIEYAKGIPGVWKSSGDYERIEADIHQSLPLGLCRHLNYHVSGGLFWRPKSIYFADFRYFTRRNFPDTWDDQIGGVFNLLAGEWFNASDKYVQAHVMYESPFVLFKFLRVNSTRKFLRVASRYILSERFYLSQLWTPVLPSYTEIGYGIGNHIFNIALFAGFDRWRYDGIGVKFAFELFQ